MIKKDNIIKLPNYDIITLFLLCDVYDDDGKKYEYELIDNEFYVVVDTKEEAITFKMKYL